MPMQEPRPPDHKGYALTPQTPPSIMPSMGASQDLHVQVHLEEGSLWATVAEFPGVFATGDNLDELRASLAEGIAMMLALPAQDLPKVVLGDIKPDRAEPVATTAHLVCT